MFARGNAFAAVVCVSCAILLFVAARGMYLYYDTGPRLVEETSAQPVRTVSQVPAAPSSKFDYSVAMGRTQQRLDELQARLVELTQRLGEKTRLLNQKDAECRKLEARLDESVDFALLLLSEGADADRGTRAAEASSNLANERAALRQELREAQTLRDEQETQLASLRQELGQADLELIGLQQAAATEIAGLLEEKLSLEAASGNAMLQVGEAAVLPLIDLLQHERAEVRLWATAVLGKLGPTARLAIEPLSNLLRDPDPRVATEARRALSAIEP